MKIEEIAPGLWRIPVMRGDLGNAYLAGDVLIDSGPRFGRKALLAALEGRELSGHALTHGHFDHQGCSHFVCERFGIPFFCGEGDRAAVESGDVSSLMPKPKPLLSALSRLLGGPTHPVTRTLVEGDEVGGFTVIETPGHTPGHLAFWREADRVVILGDVLFNRNPVTLRRGLTEPFRFATFDPSSNLASARKVAALGPEVICFGHGAPLRDGKAFQSFLGSLPGP